MKRSKDWMKDNAPLLRWYNDFFLIKELGLSIKEIEEMPVEQYVFYKSLLRELKIKEMKEINDAKNGV